MNDIWNLCQDEELRNNQSPFTPITKLPKYLACHQQPFSGFAKNWAEFVKPDFPLNLFISVMKTWSLLCAAKLPLTLSTSKGRAMMISRGITPASIDIEFCKGCIYLFHELDSWFANATGPMAAKQTIICKMSRYMET